MEREKMKGSSVDMELVAEMKEKTGRLARQTTRGGEDEVGGYQEVGDVGGVNFARDSGVVAGGASVFEDSAAIGGKPDETEDSGIKSRGGSAEIVNRQTDLVDAEDFGQVEGGGGGVADGNVCGGEQSGSRDEVVVWGRRCFGSAERARVDYGALKLPTTTFFNHLVGGRRKDAGDGAGTAPGNNVVGAAVGT